MNAAPPSSTVVSDPLSRRRVVWEILLVLGLSLGASAVYSVVSIVARVTSEVPLGDQATVLNPSRSPRPWLDLTYQLLAIGFALVPVLLAVYLLAVRPGRRPVSETIGWDWHLRRGSLRRGSLRGGSLLHGALRHGAMPQETPLRNTVQPDAPPQETLPHRVPRQGPLPHATSRQDTLPQHASQQDTLPQATPQATLPQDTLPHATPQATLPQHASQQSTLPQDTPQATLPHATPQGTLPHATPQQDTLPQETPQGTLPHGTPWRGDVVAACDQRGAAGTRAPLLAAGRRRRDLLWGLALAAAVGLPGLAFYAVGRLLGITVAIQASALDSHWWTIPVLVLSAIRHGLIEEVIVVAYLYERTRDLGWSPGGRVDWRFVAVTAVFRGSYHLYQGFGPFLGNVAMGVLFAWWFTSRWGRHRVMPLVVAHALINTVAFVGYPLLPDAWRTALGFS